MARSTAAATRMEGAKCHLKRGNLHREGPAPIGVEGPAPTRPAASSCTLPRLFVLFAPHTLHWTDEGGARLHAPPLLDAPTEAADDRHPLAFPAKIVAGLCLQAWRRRVAVHSPSRRYAFRSLWLRPLVRCDADVMTKIFVRSRARAGTRPHGSRTLTRPASTCRSSPATPILFQWARPPQVAADVSAFMNDAALEMCANTSNRLRALCQVPLQDVDLACREVERAMASGHVGVHIGNHVGTKDLDDDGLIAFLQHCASIDAPVLVHPWDMANPDDRLSRYMMGCKRETHTRLSIITALSLSPHSPADSHAHTHSSFFARRGRSACLRDPSIHLLHGPRRRLRPPPTLPPTLLCARRRRLPLLLLGRLENAWHERSIARGKSEHPPSYYLDRFSVDSAVFDPRAMRLLVETMGLDRVLLGSDYPFPLGEQQIGSLVRSCDGLSEADRLLIMGGNAQRIFGIDAPGYHARTHRGCV